MLPLNGAVDDGVVAVSDDDQSVLVGQLMRIYSLGWNGGGRRWGGSGGRWGGGWNNGWNGGWRG